MSRYYIAYERMDSGYCIRDNSAYLAHHGIQGQKWGVRRWQYKDGSLTPEGYPHYGYNGPRKKTAEKPPVRGRVRMGTSTEAAKGLTKEEAIRVYNEQREKEGPIDHKRKGSNREAALTVAEAAAGSGLIAVAAATGDVQAGAYGGLLAGHAVYRTGQAANAYYKEGQAKKRISAAEIDEKTGLPLKSKSTSVEQDVKAVNPGFKNFNTNTKNNCVLCSTALELRRRGYDVMAAKAGVGYESEEYLKWFKGAKEESLYGLGIESYFESPSNEKLEKFINDTAAKQPDGARGYINVAWIFGGGHSMAYEVKDGKPIIYDSQQGKRVELNDFLGLCCDVGLTRLDNLEMDLDQMRKDGVI